MIRIIKSLATTLATGLNLNYQDAEQEVWWMLETITGLSKTKLLMHDDYALTDKHHKTLESWVHQRITEKKPLQYIIGSVPFCDLTILVRPPILIPRPETEEWVSWLITMFQPVREEKLRILDVCTGSGCIALALAKAFPQSTVVGLDINPEAIAVSNENKAHNAIENVTFICSDLFSSLDTRQKFHLIVSNPPYISEEEFQDLDPDVTLWEDQRALVAPDNGLALYQKILKDASKYLTIKTAMQTHNLANIALEVGTNPAAVKDLMKKNKFSNIQIFIDLQHKIRCFCASLKGLI